jgi:hypothetical protein
MVCQHDSTSHKKGHAPFAGTYPGRLQAEKPEKMAARYNLIGIIADYDMYIKLDFKLQQDY